MAVLPTSDDMQRLIPQDRRRISRPSMDAVTAPARALERLGEATRQVGEDLYNKKQRYDLTQAENEFLRRRLQLEREIPESDLDYSQWGDRYKSALEEARSEIASTLGSEAQQEFINRSETDIIRGNDSIQRSARKEEITQGRAKLDISLGENLDSALGSDDPAVRQRFLKGINQQIDAAVDLGYVTPEEGANLKKEYGESYVKRRISMLPTDQQVAVLSAGKYGPNMDPKSEVAMSTLERMWGRKLNVTSTHRTEAENEAVGGADGSQHLNGRAFDVDVSDLTIEERQSLIRAARAAGFSGIGVYNNSLHFDTGGDRAWGPSYGNESLPDWAKMAVVAPVGEVNAPSALDIRMAQFIPPDETAILLDRATREYERELQRAETQYVSEFDDYINAIRVGADIDPILDRRYSNEAIDQSIMDYETREILKDTREQAFMFADSMERVKFMSPDEIVEASKEYELGSVNDRVDMATATSRAQDANTWASAVRETLRQRAEDPAAYASQSPYVKNAVDNMSDNPTEYARKTLIEQGRLGIAQQDQRIFSDSMVENYVREFSGMDIDQRALALAQFKESWGDYGDRAVNELMADDNLPPEMAVALRFADNPALSAEIMSVATLDLNELKKGIDGPDFNDLELSLDEELVDYQQAFEAGDFTGEAVRVFNMNRDVALKLATKYTRDGRDDAVERVVRKMFPETVVNEPQMRVVIPEEYDARQFERLLERSMSVDVLRQHNPVPLDDPNLPEFADIEVLLNNVKSSGVWVNNSTGDGAVLMLDIDGFMIPVKVKKKQPGGGEEEVFYERKFNSPSVANANQPEGWRFGGGSLFGGLD